MLYKIDKNPDWKVFLNILSPVLMTACCRRACFKFVYLQVAKQQHYYSYTR